MSRRPSRHSPPATAGVDPVRWAYARDEKEREQKVNKRCLRLRQTGITDYGELLLGSRRFQLLRCFLGS